MELIVIIAVVFAAVWFALRLAGDVINLAAAVIAIMMLVAVAAINAAAAAVSWAASRICRR